MGLWGYGPFDSDAALDWLSSLANEVSSPGVSGGPATIDHARVVGTLASLFAGATFTFETTAEICYAAVGLVAARLAGAPEDDTGTNLGESDSAVPDLGAHCGHLALLRAQDAERLRSRAAGAVNLLAQKDTWVARWRDPELARANLRALAGMLAP